MRFELFKSCEHRLGIHAIPGSAMKRRGPCKPKEAAAAPADEPRQVLLFAARLARCFSVSAVPLAGLVALPKSAPLCLQRTLLPSDMWRPCGAVGEGHMEAPKYVLALWLSVQFLYNFIKSCFSDPGRCTDTAPEDGRYRVPVPWSDQLFFLPRWCEHCRRWKPPRAHHSKRLGRCVLRMDHYCAITGNVVGQRNHGSFLLMVFFGHIGLLYALFMVARTFLLAWRPYWELFAVFAKYARKRGNYYQWLILGGHLHVLKALLGFEVCLLLVLAVLALLLLAPLLRHLRLALEGTTRLEELGSRDVIELSEDQVMCLQCGDFSRGPWQELLGLLGRRWMWRLLPEPRESSQGPV
ncbi:unnamed protein product, partial [Effrenium voratum]